MSSPRTYVKFQTVKSLLAPLPRALWQKIRARILRSCSDNTRQNIFWFFFLVFFSFIFLGEIVHIELRRLIFLQQFLRADGYYNIIIRAFFVVCFDTCVASQTRVPTWTYTARIILVLYVRGPFCLRDN